MNKITRQTMIDHCKREVARGSIYVWGAQGQRGNKITAKWIRSMETTTVNGNRAVNKWESSKKTHDPNMIGAYDCSGLIAACLNDNGNPGWDNTADGMYRQCVKIQKSELQPGDFVFEWTSSKNKSNHIGVYIGDNKVIESKGRDDGVCMTDLNKRNWVRFGRPDFCYKAGNVVVSSVTASKAPISLPDSTLYYRVITTASTRLRRSASTGAAIIRELRSGVNLRYRGKSGNYYLVSIDDGSGVQGYVQSEYVKANYIPNRDSVKQVQKVLGLSIDGLYGIDTAEAIGKFQASHRLTADCIYGTNTRNAILAGI